VRFAFQSTDIPQVETVLLWRDLRARVERMGDPSLMIALAEAKAQTGNYELINDAMLRFHPEARSRLSAYTLLAMRHGTDIPVAAQDMIWAHIDSLLGVANPELVEWDGIARAYWALGRQDAALDVLSHENDPERRAWVRGEFLSNLPTPTGTGITPTPDPDQEPGE